MMATLWPGRHRGGGVGQRAVGDRRLDVVGQVDDLGLIGVRLQVPVQHLEQRGGGRRRTWRTTGRHTPRHTRRRNTVLRRGGRPLQRAAHRGRRPGEPGGDAGALHRGPQVATVSTRCSVSSGSATPKRRSMRSNSSMRARLSKPRSRSSTLSSRTAGSPGAPACRSRTSPAQHPRPQRRAQCAGQRDAQRVPHRHEGGRELRGRTASSRSARPSPASSPAANPAARGRVGARPRTAHSAAASAGSDSASTFHGQFNQEWPSSASARGLAAGSETKATARARP
jgi:hypothetical protein